MEPSSEIEKILHRTLGVEGMMGGMIFNSSGTVLGSCISDNFENPNIEEICGIVSGTIVSINDLEVFPNQMTYNFRDKLLVVKWLDSAILLLVSTISSNIAMLNIVVNVTAKKLSKFLVDSKRKVPTDSHFNHREIRKEALPEIETDIQKSSNPDMNPIFPREIENGTPRNASVKKNVETERRRNPATKSGFIMFD